MSDAFKLLLMSLSDGSAVNCSWLSELPDLNWNAAGDA